MSKTVLFILIVIAVLIVGIFIMALAWQWVVPDVFAGAVEKGILPASLTFLQALKLWVLLVVIGLIGTRSSK